MTPFPRYDELDLRRAASVIAVLEHARDANLNARCRRGSVDVISPDDGTSRRLIATGDLHDNPVHLARLVHAAGLYSGSLSHLTLHEVVHGGRLVNEMDFSFRALVRVAALKAAHPEYVHTLLANHELSQIVGSGIVKDGVNVVRAFNDAIDFTFADDAPAVQAAIAAFIRSKPLALIAGTILCAHSLPAPDLMDRFDPTVLSRPLAEEDYIPRRGSAHLMVWGRSHTPAQLESLAQQWGVSLFILGHEHAHDGALLVTPNAVVLNSDHELAKVIEIDLDSPPSTPEHAVRLARPV